jgi:hypothetical protein
MPWGLDAPVSRRRASDDAAADGATAVTPAAVVAAPPIQLPAAPAVAPAVGAPPAAHHASGSSSNADHAASSGPRRSGPPPARPPVDKLPPTGAGANGALGAAQAPTGAPVIALLFAAALFVATGAWRPLGSARVRLTPALAGFAIERPD